MTEEEEVTETPAPQPVEQKKRGQEKKRSAPQQVGVCTSCRSVNPESYLKKNSFWQARKTTPCKFCGGVLVRTSNSPHAIQRAIASSEKQV